MRPHEKLDVWKKSVEMVTTVYGVTKAFPADEKFGLTSQIRRAGVSVPANIAEGAARVIKNSASSYQLRKVRRANSKQNY